MTTITFRDAEAALEAEVLAAREREADAQRRVRERAEQIDRKKAEVLAEDERVSEGGEPDHELMGRLLREVRDLEVGVDLRAVNYPDEGGRPSIKVEVYDQRAEAAHKRAVAAREAAEAKLREFTRVNLSRLEVEDREDAEREAAEGTELLNAVRQMAQRWEARRQKCAKRALRAGRDALVATVPENPYQWVAEAPREAPPCLPECFWK